MNGNCYLRHAVGSFHAVNLQLYASLCLLRLRIKSVLYVYLLSRALPDDIPFTSSRFHRFLLIQSSLYAYLRIYTFNSHINNLNNVIICLRCDGIVVQYYDDPYLVIVLIDGIGYIYGPML